MSQHDSPRDTITLFGCSKAQYARDNKNINRITNMPNPNKNEKKHWDIVPSHGDILTLCLLPFEENILQAGMKGLFNYQLEEAMDEFGYTPSQLTYLDINLVMLAAKRGNWKLLQY